MSTVVSIHKHKAPGRRAVALDFLDHENGITTVRVTSGFGMSQFQVPSPVADDLEQQLEANPGDELRVLLDFLASQPEPACR